MKVLPFSVISYYCSTLNHNQPQWLIPIADECVGVQIKLWGPLITRAKKLGDNSRQ